MRLLGFPLDLAISQWQPGDRDVADFPLPIVEWPQVQATVSCSSSVTAAGNAVYGLDNVAYVAMDTIPAGNGLSGTQTVRVLARLDAANIGYGLGAVTAKIELWNNGSYVATLVSDVPVKSDVGQIITAYWDSLLLRDIDPTGANVEYKVYGYYNLGSRSLEIGAVEWEASYIPTPALASGSGAVVLSHSSVLTGGTYGAIPVATDDFNRGSIGANWLQLDSFWGVIATSGTVAYGSGSAQALPIGSQARWVGAGTFAADQYSQAAIGGLEFQSGNYHAGVLVRCSTDADSSGTSTRDFYGVSVLYDSAGPNYTTKLYKVVNGVLTTLYSASVAWSNGDVLKLTVVGSTLTAYKNGVAISGFSATDTDLSSGNPGIEAASNGTANETLDNWEGGSYAYSGIKGALAAITVSSASSVAAAGTKSAVATAACSCSSSVACVGASSHAETSTISSASGVSVVGAHAGNVDVSVPATATVTPVVTTARSEGASVSSTSSVSSGDVKNAAGTAALSSVSSVSAAGVKNAGATASCSCTSDVTCTGAGAGAVVDETATVTVVATAARAGTASVPETAASAITAAKGAARTAAISCTSSTSCTTAASHTETSTVPCTATVAVTGLHAGTAAVSVSAASSVSAQGVKGAVAAISLSAASATACSGRMGA
ncbi:MAG TPA: hypothetical protein VFP39_08750, partial [Gemmatimonadales bacterium]|nr:hypothetical protein [Gemmatimonadales bacterium]